MTVDNEKLAAARKEMEKAYEAMQEAIEVHIYSEFIRTARAYVQTIRKVEALGGTVI